MSLVYFPMPDEDVLVEPLPELTEGEGAEGRFYGMGPTELTRMLYAEFVK